MNDICDFITLLLGGNNPISIQVQGVTIIIENKL